MSILSFLYVCATGFVVAGITLNLWEILTGRKVTLSLLGEASIWMPLRVMAIVLSAPLLVMSRAVRQRMLLQDTRNGWWLLAGVSTGLSFVHGVVTLVAIGAIGG